MLKNILRKIQLYLWEKCDSVIKYGRLDHYDSPESVFVVSLRGMIYMQLGIWLFIILVSLSIGTVEKI